MSDSSLLICPICKSSNFLIKYEATYVYSYLIDSDAPGTRNTEEFLPFMFDNREQKNTRQYLECNTCGSIYSCYFNHIDKKINLKDLQAAISLKNLGNGNHKNN